MNIGRDSLRACSHGGGRLREGEVPHLPVVKKSFSSYATPGQWGEVYNTIAQSAYLWLHRRQVLLENLFIKSHETLSSIR